MITEPSPVHQKGLACRFTIISLLLKNNVSTVSPLCQRVSPFKTLHPLYLLGLCQRVSLKLEKKLVRNFRVTRVVKQKS